MNQSKMNDPRFWKRWLASGAVSKRPIKLRLPFYVDATAWNVRTGWNTISCLEDDEYVYFVTKKKLEFAKSHPVLPKDAFEFEQGRPLVTLSK